MLRGLVASAVLSAAVLVPLAAQTSEHQRIGVERETEWELGLELGNGVVRESYDSIDYISCDSYVSLDLLVGRAWTASLYAPLSSRFAVGDGVARSALVGLGDVEASAGWTGRVGDSRLSASLRVTAPTGEWSEYAEAEGVLAPGSGRWGLGVSASASRILDPVVVGASVSYDVGLPREDRFATTWRPGDMALSLSVTEVLNDMVGYTLKVSQAVALPELENGSYSLDAFAYGAIASFELWLSDGDASARVGISKSVTSADAPARIYSALSYSLRSEKHDED